MFQKTFHRFVEILNYSCVVALAKKDVVPGDVLLENRKKCGLGSMLMYQMSNAVRSLNCGAIWKYKWKRAPKKINLKLMKLKDRNTSMKLLMGMKL